MYEQISLFNGILTEICDTKPEIGTKLVFHYAGGDYDCIVAKHCGFDFFWVEFTGRKPSDDFKDLGDSDGWHVSLRGYKKDWSFSKDHLTQRGNEMENKNICTDINLCYDLAEKLLQFSKDENYYEFLDNVPDEESMFSVVYEDMKSGNIESYITYIKEALFEDNMESETRVDATYLLFQLQHLNEYKDGIVSAVDLVLNNGKKYTYYFPYTVTTIDVDEMDMSRTAVYKTNTSIPDTLVAQLHNAFTGTDLEKKLENELKISWVMSIYEDATVVENDNRDLVLASRLKRKGR